MADLEKQNFTRKAVECFLEAAVTFEKVSPGMNDRLGDHYVQSCPASERDPFKVMRSTHSMIGEGLTRLCLAGWSVALIEPKP